MTEEMEEPIEGLLLETSDVLLLGGGDGKGAGALWKVADARGLGRTCRKGRGEEGIGTGDRLRWKVVPGGRITTVCGREGEVSWELVTITWFGDNIVQSKDKHKRTSMVKQ